MAVGDLFKSKKDRKREEAGKRRRAFREAGSAVDVVMEWPHERLSPRGAGIQDDE
jgi:hypothetical protein